MRTYGYNEVATDGVTSLHVSHIKNNSLLQIVSRAPFGFVQTRKAAVNDMGLCSRVLDGMRSGLSRLSKEAGRTWLNGKKAAFVAKDAVIPPKYPRDVTGEGPVSGDVVDSRNGRPGAGPMAHPSRTRPWRAGKAGSTVSVTWRYATARGLFFAQQGGNFSQ